MSFFSKCCCLYQECGTNNYLIYTGTHDNLAGIRLICEWLIAAFIQLEILIMSFSGIYSANILYSGFIFCCGHCIPKSGKGLLKQGSGCTNRSIYSVSAGGTLQRHVCTHKMWCFQFPSSRASCRSVICLARLDGIRVPLTALITITTHSEPASQWIDMLDILKMGM